MDVFVETGKTSCEKVLWTEICFILTSSSGMDCIVNMNKLLLLWGILDYMIVVF